MKALALALRYLERKARTEAEIRQKLVDKQVPPQEIEAVLVKLKSYGYINDEKYAVDFQRARNDYKPMGVRRIKLELQQKGIEKEIIAKVAADKEAEYQLALEAAQTRLRQYRNLTPDVFYRRMTGFLARRGFNYETIKQVFEHLKKSS
jgi:regulatory protein